MPLVTDDVLSSPELDFCISISIMYTGLRVKQMYDARVSACRSPQ